MQQIRDSLPTAPRVVTTYKRPELPQIPRPNPVRSTAAKKPKTAGGDQVYDASDFWEQPTNADYASVSRAGNVCLTPVVAAGRHATAVAWPAPDQEWPGQRNTGTPAVGTVEDSMYTGGTGGCASETHIRSNIQSQVNNFIEDDPWQLPHDGLSQMPDLSGLQDIISGQADPKAPTDSITNRSEELKGDSHDEPNDLAKAQHKQELWRHKITKEEMEQELESAQVHLKKLEKMTPAEVLQETTQKKHVKVKEAKQSIEAKKKELLAIEKTIGELAMQLLFP